MLLLSTDSLPHYGLERVFEFAKKANFDGIEVAVSDNLDTQNPEYLKRLSERTGMPIKAFSLDPKGENDRKEAFQHTVREFPGSTINLSPPKTLAFEYKKWLTELVPRLAQKYDLTLCRKNVPAKNMLGVIPERSDNSVYALKQAGDVCLDVTALAISNEEIMRTVSFLGDHLKHIYLSNVTKGIPYSLPQVGILPIESFLTKLAQIRYKKDFTLKVHPKVLSEGDDEKMLTKLIETREFYEKYFVKPSQNV